MSDFLWVEQYRPQTIDECILPTDIKETFQSFVDRGEISNLLLAGPPGCGKTTMSKYISKKTKMKMIDSDSLIEEKYKKSLILLIKEIGNKEFGKIEYNILKEIVKKNENVIISPGGSVIYYDELFKLIEKMENFIVIYLKTTLDIIKKRTDNFTNRGIIFENTTFDEFYKRRCNLYDKYSDITIDCSEKSIENISNLILNLLYI